MSIKNIIIVCVLFFVMCIMLPMWAIGTKNHAISLEESVTNSYSDINVQEAYPELKADKTFTNLQLELATTENLIAEHRKAYNLSAKIYRQYVRRFPNSMFLSVFGYEQIEAKSLDFGTESKKPIKNMFGD